MGGYGTAPGEVRLGGAGSPGRRRAAGWKRPRAGEAIGTQKPRTERDLDAGLLKVRLAAPYSPTGWPRQYHPRGRA